MFRFRDAHSGGVSADPTFDAAWRDVAEVIERTKLSAGRIVDTVFAGEYQSAFRGSGLEFEESREYAFGDDVRRMDWNVTARTGRLHVKVLREERRLRLIFGVHLAPTWFVGTRGRTKNETALLCIAALALAAVKRGDSAGAMVFGDGRTGNIAAAGGMHRPLVILREIMNTRSSAPRPFGGVLRELCEDAPGGSTVVLATDLGGLAADFEKDLEWLYVLKAKSDVCAIIVRDRLEEEFPRVGRVRTTDASAGTFAIVDGSGEKFRKKIAANVEIRRRFEDYLARNKVDYVTIFGDDSVSGKLLEFLLKRKNRIGK